jgi:S1-C subfamily serine protease
MFNVYRVVLTVISILCFGLSSIAGSDTTLTDSEILDQDGVAIVALTLRDASGGELNQSTGFIVSPVGHVLTVAHVRPTGPGEYMEAVIGQATGVVHRLSSISVDVERDVALYVLDQSQGCRPSLPLSVDRPRVTDELLALGFPKGLGLTPIAAKVANLYGPDGLIIVDGFLGPGTSGGPVFQRDGHVMGIVRGGHPADASNNHVIPIAYASGLLQMIERWPPQQSIEVYPIECYKSCPAAENGIDKWEAEVPWQSQTGWLGGGSNRTDACNALKAQWQAANPGHSVEIRAMDEVNNKDLLGHVEYRYICAGISRSGPIYRSAPSRTCGLRVAP